MAISLGRLTQHFQTNPHGENYEDMLSHLALPYFIQPFARFASGTWWMTPFFGVDTQWRARELPDSLHFLTFNVLLWAFWQLFVLDDDGIDWTHIFIFRAIHLTAFWLWTARPTRLFWDLDLSLINREHSWFISYSIISYSRNIDRIVCWSHSVFSCVVWPHFASNDLDLACGFAHMFQLLYLHTPIFACHEFSIHDLEHSDLLQAFGSNWIFMDICHSHYAVWVLEPRSRSCFLDHQMRRWLLSQKTICRYRTKRSNWPWNARRRNSRRRRCVVQPLSNVTHHVT